MKKADLLASIQSKAGFVSIISDNVAPDSTHATKQKKYLVIETANSNGTKGMYNVFYVHDTETDEASFYNVEPPVSFDITYKDANTTVVESLVAYCKTAFDAFFITRIDGVNRWAEVESFKANTEGKLVKTNVMVYKKGTNPITHAQVI